MESTFNEYLVDEYLRLAEYEQSTEADYRAAENYMDKVARIERGRIARIDNLENFTLSDWQVKEFKQAQDELVNALKNFRLAENRKRLAVAHSRYDCWLDQAEENNKKQNCKKEFKRAMNNLLHPLGNEEFIESEEEFFGLNAPVK